MSGNKQVSEQEAERIRKGLLPLLEKIPVIQMTRCFFGEGELEQKTQNTVDQQERISHLIDVFEHNGFYLEERDCGFRVWEKVYECKTLEELDAQVNNIVGDKD